MAIDSECLNSAYCDLKYIKIVKQLKIIQLEVKLINIATNKSNAIKENTNI